jgi:hypothetical protein
LSSDQDGIYSEVDRQLAEVRAACDGLATRAGLLFAASGIAAALLAPSIHADRRQDLLRSRGSTAVTSGGAGDAALPANSR